MLKKFIKNARLQIKFAIAITLVLLFTFSLLGGFIFFFQSSQIIEQSDERLFSQLDDLLNILKTENQFYEDKISLLVARVEKSTKENQTSLSSQAILKEIGISSNTRITIYQKEGNQFKSQLTTDSLPMPPLADSILSQINNQQIFKSTQISIDKNYYIRYLKPIIIDEKVQGAIEINLLENHQKSALNTLIKNKVYFESGFPYILRGDGFILFHPKDDREQLDLRKLNIRTFTFMNQNKQKPTKYFYIDQFGNRKYQYLVYYAPFDIYVAIVMSEDELITKPIKLIRNLLFWGCVISIFLSVITINLFIKNIITNSLHFLISKLNQMARGEIIQIERTGRGDEVGQIKTAIIQLNEAFNKASLFANDMGKGKFDTLFIPLSEKDVLGNALINMRKEIKEANDKEEKNRAEVIAQNEELQQQQEELLMVNESLNNKNKLIEQQKAEIDSQIEDMKIINNKLKSNEDILKKSYHKLKESEAKVKEQNANLAYMKEEVEISYLQLKNTSERLNKSIKYAYNIQQIILPKKDKLDSFFQSHFSLYMPKDVVSGDFYWFTLLEDGKAIFALADCTGHGVPGAFMSMVGGTLLHETIKIKGVTEPARILRNLHAGVRNVLKQEESQNSDGMDISVCLFEKNTETQEYQITFAGAKNSVFYIKDNQVNQLDGDRITIGGFTERKREFTNQQINIQQGEMIYFASDGYIDQHNVDRQRFSSGKFKHLLSSIYELPILEQEQIIIKTLKEHQQKEEQRDDISVVGIRL